MQKNNFEIFFKVIVILTVRMQIEIETSYYKLLFSFYLKKIKSILQLQHERSF